METKVVIALIELVNRLSEKPVLTDEERKVYLEGLIFIEWQYRMYNSILDDGMDALNVSDFNLSSPN